jgi:15-cis-phytoene synthase
VEDSYSHCEALVRTADKDRYIAALFAPLPARRHLYALYAFASEISRVATVVHEPIAGELRLQWWRDALSGAGEARANPVAAALLDTLAQCGLSTERLTALIDAHAFDLYDDPPASVADLDAYAVSTSGTLFTLGAQILGVLDADSAAERAGVAYGVTQMLRRFPIDIARQRIFLPRDLAARHGIHQGELERRRATPGLQAALSELRAHARDAFAGFRAAAQALPAAAAPAFLVAALVPQALDRLDAAAANPFEAIEVPQWRRQWTLWRASRRWPAV